MNVLISILKYPPDFTGAGLRTARMYRNLQTRGYLDRVYVITSGSCSGEPKPRSSGRHEIRYTGFNPYITTPESRAKKLKKSIFVLRAGILTIIQYLRIFKKVDIVHTIDSSWLSTIIGWCCYISHKPLVKEIVLLGSDDPVSIARNKKNPLRSIFLFPFQSADLVVVLSEALKQSCLSFGIPAGKIWYRLNPVYLEPAEQHWVDCHTDPRLDPGKPFILHVGRITRRKNIGFLIQSAAYLKGDALLVFVGPWDDPAYRQEILHMAERLHDTTDGHVDSVFLGRIVDRKSLSCLYAKSKLFWFASRNEGMPNAVLESLVAGTPVVSLALEGTMAEVIEQGQNGEIVESDNPAVFGAAVDRWLHKHDTDRSRISRRAQQRFDPVAVEKEYLERFRRILSLPGAAQRSDR